MRYDAVVTEALHDKLCDDLLVHVRQGKSQEDLRFALWRPATGSGRMSALVFDVLEPQRGERELHGNVSFDAPYLTRAIRTACHKNAGLAFMHNHLTPGWQDMSEPDIVAERDRISPPANATGLPVLGMTLGTDGSWSARVWLRDGNRYRREWCDKVRVVGQRLQVTYNDSSMPPPKRHERLRRTVDTWGEQCQGDLARLRVGVVGVGSVGAMIAETLARMGIENLVLVDPDRVEAHNLDRLLHAGQQDVGEFKALLTAGHLRRSATAKGFHVTACTLPIQHEEALGLALDCDLLFSAVDRPLPKDLLNRIAYTHCIPVVSGGVFIDNKPDGTLGQAAWAVTTIGPGRRCLRCDGQYSSSDVVMERDGSLDDPSYIQNVRGSVPEPSNQNVFPFSANLASFMVIAMIRLVIAPEWWPNVGSKLHYSMIPSRLTSGKEQCGENCSVAEGLTRGDEYMYPFIDRVTAPADGGVLKRLVSLCRRCFGGFSRKYGNSGR